MTKIVSSPPEFAGDGRAWYGGAWSAAHGVEAQENPYVGGFAESWFAGYRAQEASNTDSTPDGEA